MTEHVSLAEGGTIAALTAVVVAGLQALGQWLGPRLMGKAAIDDMLTKRYSAFADDMREERVALLNERAAERLVWANERAELRGELLRVRGEVNGLRATVQSYKRIMDKAGVTTEVPGLTPHPMLEVPPNE